MTRWPLCLSILALVAPPMAQAGAWPREAGTVFVATGAERDRDGNSYASLYAEYGLSPRTTVGVELGHTTVGETTALVWAQRPLDDGKGAHRFSVGFGLGAVWRDGAIEPLAQTTLAWGRGFDSRLAAGWLSARGSLRIALSPADVSMAPADPTEAAFLTPETSVKSELTLGLHAREGLMLINELWFEDRDDVAFSAKLATSAVVDIAGPLKLQLGVIEPLRGPGESSVRLGSWVTF